MVNKVQFFENVPQISKYNKSMLKLSSFVIEIYVKNNNCDISFINYTCFYQNFLRISYERIILYIGKF